jgi:hypothetical protein
MSSLSFAHAVTETVDIGSPSSPIGVRVRSMDIFRVFNPQPAHLIVPSVPGSFATLESPVYGEFPMNTHT